MNLSKISEIVDVTSCRDVNRYLDSGWVIVNIHNAAFATGDPKTFGQTAHFTLGWKGKDPKYPDLSPDYGTSDFLNPE
ncbi:hypothetical protein D7Y41_23790 [Anaerotruncus sp. 1XD22-93]|nr:hypothetical protein [Anaerotruncus sp. 1XD42-93]RKJ82490.1 hypothetical protein D7Y41_23790 [Anaerotruncus sp. 1XD22-93]